MKQAQQPINRGQVAQIQNIPAPVGGWNARDSLTDMDPKDAIILDNFFCTPYDVGLRQGYSVWSTGLSGNCNTLQVYTPPGSSVQMFGMSGQNLYNVTNQGAVGAPTVTGNSSDQFQYVNFGTPGGDFMVSVSGVDLPLVYDGVSWGNMFGAAFNTTVTSITSVGTTATVTTSSPHHLKSGFKVVVAGYTPVGYNGTYVITVTSPTIFTYQLAGALGVTTVTGTVTPSVNFTTTGVDPTKFSNICIFKTRLFFVLANSLQAWYLPSQSIGGAASVVDISSFCRLGGYLVNMVDWTLDAGYGMDDYLAFITSMGEVVVYKGTDPSSASTWAMIGVYTIGRPVGARCMAKYGGDSLIIGMDGLGAMSQMLMSSRVSSQQMLTDKVQHIISEYTTNYSQNFGWEIDLFPTQNMLILNVPISSTQVYQVVMNTISGAWSRFLGWNAFCLELNQDQLFFGAANSVCLAWNTASDNGANINFEAQQAFSYLGDSPQLKQVSMLRPVISSDGNPSILLGVNADYDMTPPVGIPSFTPISTNTGVWDVSKWDDGSVWGGGLVIKKDWQTAFCTGYAISPHLTGGFANYQLRWLSTDVLFTIGGVL